ncbi:MAG: hypothetical protein RID11_13925 [Roseovarius sp.]|uniref:glycosyltransferase n=1 Tax=Roseovarius sp. TaxID=1486281 RepID=UPI0032ED2195
MSDAPYAFILSWERPVFLWACLDSLYRNTRKDLRFILIDNNSQDPLVRQVIQGFDKRDMFEEILMFEENDPHRMNKVMDVYAEKIGSYFYFIENDVTVPDHVCWAAEYERIYRTYPDIAMVGSFCEKSDFIPPEIIRDKDPSLDDKDVVFYSKKNSPERNVTPDPATDIWPHDSPTPPGRLILLSKEAILKTGFHPDAKLAREIGKNGFHWRVCTTFQHRHLSLLNWYDTPDEKYREQRTEYFRAMNSAPGRNRLLRYLDHKLDRLKHRLWKTR